jgi:hypothetical protein
MKNVKWEEIDLIDKKVKDLLIIDQKFYHFKSDKNHIATLVVLTGLNNIRYCGLSVKSGKDQFNKRYGIFIANERAKKIIKSDQYYREPSTGLVSYASITRIERLGKRTFLLCPLNKFGNQAFVNNLGLIRERVIKFISTFSNTYNVLPPPSCVLDIDSRVFTVDPNIIPMLDGTKQCVIP